MIKKIIFSLVLLPMFLIGQDQNSWINYDQNYFKFPVSEQGIYRIEFEDLVGAGINVTSLDPRNLQIFAKGVEIPIYIQGESDGSFDSGDFIEFFGEKNDGWYDHNLFSDSSHNVNPFISMFSDTLYHFLTWNGSTSNERYLDDLDLNFGDYTPIDYYFKTFVSTAATDFSVGQITNFGWAVPEYSKAEGWYASSVGSTYSAASRNTLANVYTGGPSANIKIKIFGLGPANHLFGINVSGNEIYNDFFYGKEDVNIDKMIPASWLEGTSEVLFRSLATVENANDKVGISYVEFKYPKTLDMAGTSSELMYIPSGSELKDLLIMENYNNLSSTVRIFDITAKKRVPVQPLLGKYYALVPNNGEERKCFLTAEAAIKSISGLQPVSEGSSKFINYQKTISDKGGVDFLLLTGRNMLEAGREYGDYRESQGLKTIVVDMDQLYDQFSYGIRKHPLSIRNFCDALINTWDEDPQYLFLAGKSISADNYSFRFGGGFEGCIVPTWGVLGADVGFTSGLKPGSVLDPTIATGRLAAKSNEELRNYLGKVIDYESAEHGDWMKQTLHFGGGSTSAEQKQFKEYLEDYEGIIEDTMFGGNVHTFLKNSSDPLTINLSDSVTNLINEGVSIMTFFGHAYGNNFDQSIDEPENYENTGRYSFILANSCLIGNIHTPSSESGSERFVLAKDKGSIGFLGSSSLGVPGYLYQYSRDFYENLSKGFYGQAVGKVLMESVKDMQDSSNVLNRDVAMHMTLHCDPAIVLNSMQLPDYTVYRDDELTEPGIRFNPQNVTNDIDSFDISVEIKNIGMAKGDTFTVLVTRDFPGVGFPDTTYSIRIDNIKYSTEISLRLPVDKINGVGLNRFSIRVDALGEVDELTELNNNIDLDFFIGSSDLVPVYPYEFSVVPERSNILKASTGNPYSAPTNYVFQIDTSDKFDSPVATELIINSSGGVVEWDPADSPELASFYSRFSDATTISRPRVYFWRVSVDSATSGEYNWKESSFQYVADKSGWGQSHFHQFKNDEFEFIDYNYGSREFSFIEQIKNLSAKTHGSAASEALRQEIKYEIDGAIQAFESSEWSTMFFLAVIDRNTLKPWHALEHGDYGHINYNPGKYIPHWNGYNFYFLNNSAAGIDSIIQFVEDVPDSNYVLFYSFRGNNCAGWLEGKPISADYESFLAGIGANVDSLKNYNVYWPYILFFKKGDPSSVVESFSPDGSDFIYLSGEMKNNWFNGRIRSPLIGPTTSWESFHWEINAKEPLNDRDTSLVNVYGIDEAGNETLVIGNLPSSGDILTLGDSIDASLYPYIRLEAFFADDSLRTPDELVRWQVLHEEIPEAAINPLKLSGYTLIDSVQQGEDYVFVTAIENISSVAMDSLQVSYRVIDNKFKSLPFEYTIKKPMAPGEVLYDTIYIPTAELIGLNDLWYEINPFEGPKEWQLEQYHFNNLFLHKFGVFPDEINPILDVTFDGIHILDGDIVHPQPNIVITLDDENQFLKLDDESLVQLYLNYPRLTNDPTLRDEDSIVFIDPSLYIFTPAELPKNKCTIEFTGDFPMDGVYELRVLAADKSSNVSGDGDGSVDYRIKFEVITESSITQLINYPNPFSTSTRFVFTLTGSEVPDNILIQIMTITGKVVREITQEELGPINIGRNITEFEWDGTDEYGDKLANGVYLYKVQVQKDGADMNKRDVNVSSFEGSSKLTDKFFKKGLGKMYILR